MTLKKKKGGKTLKICLKSFAPEKWVPFGAEYNALVIVDIRPLSGSGNPRDILIRIDRLS